MASRWLRRKRYTCTYTCSSRCVYCCCRAAAALLPVLSLVLRDCFPPPQSPHIFISDPFHCICICRTIHFNRYKILAENHFALDAVASALSALVPTSLANASNRVLRSMALDGLDTAIAKAAGLQVRLKLINTRWCYRWCIWRTAIDSSDSMIVNA